VIIREHRCRWVRLLVTSFLLLVTRMLFYLPVTSSRFLVTRMLLEKIRSFFACTENAAVDQIQSCLCFLLTRDKLLFADKDAVDPIQSCLLVTRMIFLLPVISLVADKNAVDQIQSRLLVTSLLLAQEYFLLTRDKLDQIQSRLLVTSLLLAQECFLLTRDKLSC